MQLVPVTYRELRRELEGVVVSRRCPGADYTNSINSITYAKVGQ
jgi:hypothetical protein